MPQIRLYSALYISHMKRRMRRWGMHKNMIPFWNATKHILDKIKGPHAFRSNSTQLGNATLFCEKCAGPRSCWSNEEPTLIISKFKWLAWPRPLVCTEKKYHHHQLWWPLHTIRTLQKSYAVVRDRIQHRLDLWLRWEIYAYTAIRSRSFSLPPHNCVMASKKRSLKFKMKANKLRRAIKVYHKNQTVVS